MQDKKIKYKINFEKIKNCKLYFLQSRYKYLSDIILKLEKHLNNLLNNNIIEYSYCNHILGKIFVISKNLNSIYNNYIINKLDEKDILYDKINDLLKHINNLSDSFLFENIILCLKSYGPLIDIENELINIIEECGIETLNDLLIIYSNKIEINSNTTQFINELSKIFIPIKVSLYDVINHTEDYYWRFPTLFSDNDFLELKRELWIKNISKQTQYLKIEGIFINDSLSCFIKNSQLNYSNIQKIKMNILSELNNMKIDMKFIKKFIRYDYLGNIYCMNSSQYIKYIQSSYEKFLELSNMSFINIMKDFIANGSEIKYMFELIFILLLGNNDNSDIAGLLLGLTKENKTNKEYIYNIIYNRLPYYLLLKIKKSNTNIKNELEKIKNITIEDIDYKKQLITNKNIPILVKTMIIEKIEEMKLSNNEYYKQLTYVKHLLNYPWSSINSNNIFTNLKSDTIKSKEYLINIETKLKNLSYGHMEAKKIYYLLLVNG